MSRPTRAPARPSGFSGGGGGGGGGGTPPVLSNPAVQSITLGDADPTLAWGNSGGALTSSAASITEAPAGSTATLTHSSPSLSVTLAGVDAAGSYVIDYTATNADGSAAGRAVVEVASAAPTADAGASQQQTGGTVNLDASGSTAAGGRTITGYSWAWASNSPATATLTGAATATPSFTAVAGSTYVPEVTVTDSEGETATATTQIYPAASVVTHVDIDLTSATPNASLADGDTIYQADGTTAIGVMRIGDGLINGTTNLQASIGAGGLEFTAELASGQYTWAHCSFPLDVSAIDWTAEVVVVMLQYRVEAIGAKVYEGAGCIFGEDGRPRTTGSGHNWTCMAIDSDVVNERAQDYAGNVNYSLGTTQATGATLPQEYVGAFVVEGGSIVHCYWRRGTTLFDGVPDPSDADVYVQSFGESNGVGVSETKNFGTEIAVGLHGICYTIGAGNAPVVQLKRVKIIGAGPGRD